MPGVERYIVKVESGKEARDGRPSVGPVYRSILAKDGFPSPPPGIETCWDLFSNSVKRFPNRQMLGHREQINNKVGKYIWQTYQEVYDAVICIGSALRACGVNPKDRCGVYGVNCPEWLMTMEACNGHSIYCVPLYDTLGVDAVEFILRHAEVSIIFVQEAKLPLIIKSLPRCIDYVKRIVSFGGISAKQREEIQNSGIVAYSWVEFINLGKEESADLVLPNKNDISTIMYTSGTTGEPKGVLITHESIVDLIAGVDHLLASLGEKITEEDVYFSFLPLAHIFDRAVEEFFVKRGASIGYWQGDVKLLIEDVSELKPTLFAAVPRVCERIYSGTLQKVTAGGMLRKKIFDFSYRYKLNKLLSGLRQEKAAPLFDKLVFNKVKQGLGGRLRLLISGAAPLAKHVDEYLRVTTCAIVVQGYGLTETCGGSFISLPNVISMMGTVGPPVPNIDVCLESVPEMGYDALADIPCGEICIRGKCVFAGYHKRDDMTKEVLVDGWFHTGDIGEWQPDGALKVIDRKKNIFKLSQGEYVAVESIENVYSECSLVESIWVYGSSFESSLVAVVIPNHAIIENWAKQNGVEGDLNSLCNNRALKEYFLTELNGLAKSKNLKGFELLKAIHLDPQPFDMERDLLTPTYKKKRAQLYKYYKENIHALYDDLRRK